jgi:hypothetical protein
MAAARELHTRIYAQVGYVDSATEVVDDGYMSQRRWFVASDGVTPVGTLSMIYPGAGLPTLTAFGIDPVGHPKLAGPWSLGRVVELSTLAVDPRRAAPGPVAAQLYRAVWQARHRLDDHDIWLMSSQPQLFDRLCALFHAPFELLGRSVDYYNHHSVAYLLDFRFTRSAVEQRSPLTTAWLDGQVGGDVPPAGMRPSKAPARGTVP